jgi:hypothetical protein
MKYQALFALCVFVCNAHATDINTINLSQPPQTLATYHADWLVVGAGPAGISAVASLRDARIRPENIIWIDKTFNVGDLGKYYGQVLANSTRGTFYNFFGQSPQFRRFEAHYRHLNMPHKNHCTLDEVITPLQIISNRLRQEVASYTGQLDNLTYDHTAGCWFALLPGIRLEATKVILATGSHAKQLEHTTSAQRIPLEKAVDKKMLKKALPSRKGIMVFGSSHSAALVLKNLVELKCSNIIQVFKHDFRFRVKTPAGEIFPFSGLKGPVGAWAHKNIFEKPQATIRRMQTSDPHVAQVLNECTAVIDAIGFEPNTLPVKPEDLYPTQGSHHELGHNLYGIGIAFPSTIRDSNGNEETAVGLLSFMRVLKQNLPLWLAQ